MIHPNFLFVFNGFRMNLVNLIQKNYIINDKYRFENPACDFTGYFPSHLTILGLKEGVSNYWLCLSMRIK